MTEQLKDYHYEFPEELIAQAPLEQRDASRMLLLRRDSGSLKHASFLELPDFLNPGDLLVGNNTAVRSCRLYARKATGGLVEIFVLGANSPLEHRVWLSPQRGLKTGQILRIFSRATQELTSYQVELLSVGEESTFRFQCESDASKVFAEHSEMPLPPYIERPSPRVEDRSRYQTIFARHPGACAAPTAGLHFSAEVHATLKAREISWAELTLHVGPGTFLPVKTEEINQHRMHAEYYEIPEATIAAIQNCHQRGGRVIAIGTTTLRALESHAASGAVAGWTQLFIRPGYTFRVVNGLLTNFHQPRSTLLMLVSALAGRENILQAYAEAIRERYRLFSYGDCMLIL